MAPIVAQLSAILLWLAKSEQWGIIYQDATNADVSKKIIMPLSADMLIMGACSCETYACNTAIGPLNRTGSSFMYRQQAWSSGSVITDWIVLCR